MLLSRFLSVVVLGLVSLFVVPTLASATIHSFTVTGTFDFTDVPVDFNLLSSEPFDPGDTFTLTFDLDDAALLTSGNGSTVSGYGSAISNIQLSASNGSSLIATSDDVLEADNGGNHQWSFTVFTGSPGFGTDVPDVLTAEDVNTFVEEDFDLIGYTFLLLDFTTSAYSASPPELIVPTSAGFSFQSADFEWLGQMSGQSITTVTTITSISSVSGTPVPGLGLPGMGLMSLVMIGTAWIGLARRRA